FAPDRLRAPSPEAHRCRSRSRLRRRPSWWNQRPILQRFGMPSETLTGIRGTDNDLVVEPQVHMMSWGRALAIVWAGEPHVQIREHAPEFFDAVRVGPDRNENSRGGMGELEIEVAPRDGTNLGDFAHEGRSQH